MNVLPLLRRTQLLPGESLLSLLERLAQLNYYNHSGMMGWICHEGTENPCSLDNVARPKQVRTFFQLAQLTMIGPEELFAASDHCFAPVLTAPGKEKAFMPWPDGEPKQVITKAVVRHRIRRSSATQFCPLCLKESTYHRLSWIPVASNTCLRHECLLVHQCPQCGRNVSVAEIVKRQCKACKADLSEAQSVSVAGDELGMLSQQVIQSWLTVAPAPELPYGCALPDHPPAVMYRLLDGLRLSLLTCQDDWPNLPDPLAGLSEQIKQKLHPGRRMSPASSYYLYRAAFKGIGHWPQGFYQFLDAYSQRNHKTQTSRSMRGRLGTFGYNWLRKAWQGPEFEFVQQSLVDYLLTRQIPLPYTMVKRFKDIPWFIERSGLWTKEQTAQALGISAQALNRLFLYGPLGKCLWPGSRSHFRLFQREKVLAIKKQWEEGLPLKHASCWLGLGPREVVRLVELGALTVERGLDSENSVDWILNKPSVIAFFETVVSQLRLYQGDPYDLVSLHSAVRSMAWVGIDSMTLLKCVADGILPGYKLKSSLQSLSFVYFLDSMVGWSFPDVIYAERGWIRDRNFAKWRGIEIQVISTWVDSGLIEPAATFGPTRYFDLQSLERVATEYMASEN